MNDSILELEVENLRELLRLKNINKELLDSNHNLLTRLIHEYEKKGLVLEPEIEALVLRVKQVIREINPQSTDNLQGEDQPQNGQNQIRSNFYVMNAL